MPSPCIVSDPLILMGKPIIKGTRIAVEYLLEKMACGETVEQIMASHPQIIRSAILAALRFAADVLRGRISTSKQIQKLMLAAIDSFM